MRLLNNNNKGEMEVSVKSYKKTVVTILVIIVVIFGFTAIAIKNVDWNGKNSTVTLKPEKKNVLNIGELGSVVLKGNQTTGYSWYYNIEGTDIIELDSKYDAADSNKMG